MSIEATSRSSVPALDLETRLSEAIIEAAQANHRRQEDSQKTALDALRANQNEALEAMSDVATEKLAAGIAGGSMQIASAGANIASGATLSTARAPGDRGELDALGGKARVMSSMGTAFEAAGTLGKAGFDFAASHSEMLRADAEHKSDASQIAMKQHEKRADEAQAHAQKALDQFAELVRARAAMNLAAVRG